MVCTPVRFCITIVRRCDARAMLTVLKTGLTAATTCVEAVSDYFSFVFVPLHCVPLLCMPQQLDQNLIASFRKTNQFQAACSQQKALDALAEQNSGCSV
jgi:hypothetical protein